MATQTFTSSISDSARGHVLKALSTFYADSMFAVIREYVANGIDAHRAAGIDESVHVEITANDDNRSGTLTITDYGDGMSADTLKEVLYNYGESSKRNDDGKIGSFGFGAKSAFSVSPTWSMVSVHDGVKNIVKSSFADNDVPTHTMTSTKAKSERSGVTVTIPVDNVVHAVSSLNKLLFWIPEGAVHASTPDNCTDYYSRYSNRHWTRHIGLHVGNAVVVDVYGGMHADVLMGGMPYRVENFNYVVDSAVSKLRAASAIVDGDVARCMEKAFISATLIIDDPKALEVTATRDNIKNTPSNIDKMVSVLLEAMEEVATGVRSVINADVGDKVHAYLAQKSTYASAIPSAPVFFGSFDAETSAHEYTGSWERPSRMPSFIDSVSRQHVLLVTGVPKNAKLPYVNKVKESYGAQKLYVTEGVNVGNSIIDAEFGTLFASDGSGAARAVTFDEFTVLATELKREVSRARVRKEPDPVNVLTVDEGVLSTTSVPFADIESFVSQRRVPAVLVDGYTFANLNKSAMAGLSMTLIRSAGGQRDGLIKKKLSSFDEFDAKGTVTGVAERQRVANRFNALPPRIRKAFAAKWDIDSRSDYDRMAHLIEFDASHGGRLKGTRFARIVKDIAKALRSTDTTKLGSWHGLRREIVSEIPEADRFETLYPLLTGYARHDGDTYKLAQVQYVLDTESRMN